MIYCIHLKQDLPKSCLQFVQKCIQDFDTVSLYPSAMHLFEGFLKGMPKRITTTDYNELKHHDGLFLKVRVTEVGKERPFPVLSHLDKATKTKNGPTTLLINLFSRQDWVGGCRYLPRCEV